MTIGWMIKIFLWQAVLASFLIERRFHYRTKDAQTGILLTCITTLLICLCLELNIWPRTFAAIGGIITILACLMAIIDGLQEKE
jgi:hypothetical protein